MFNNSIELRNVAYPDLQANYRNKEWLSEICILAPINKLFVKLMKNYKMKSYKSIDNFAFVIKLSTEFLIHYNLLDFQRTI